MGRLWLDPVVTARGVLAHVALAHVPTHRLRLALRPRAPATAAARHDLHALTGRDRMLRRLAHVAHGAIRRRDLHPVVRAVLAAPQPPRRRRLALEAERDEGRRLELVHSLDAETSAVLPRAARVLP